MSDFIDGFGYATIGNFDSIFLKNPLGLKFIQTHVKLSSDSIMENVRSVVRREYIEFLGLPELVPLTANV